MKLVDQSKGPNQGECICSDDPIVFSIGERLPRKQLVGSDGIKMRNEDLDVFGRTSRSVRSKVSSDGVR